MAVAALLAGPAAIGSPAAALGAPARAAAPAGIATSAGPVTFESPGLGGGALARSDGTAGQVRVPAAPGPGPRRPSHLPGAGFGGILVAAIGTVLAAGGWLLMLSGSRRLRSPPPRGR